jgi:SMI1 / KNR4 family (SUKH-1)
MSVKNPIITANPFGATTDQDISRLESDIGIRLPIDYRNYLLQHNGGRFKFDSIASIDLSVHHLFGIHLGPEYLQLQLNWAPWSFHDYQYLRDLLENFITIGDCGTGELIVLNCKSGAVGIERARISERQRYKSPDEIVTKIAANFSDFVNSMKSLDDVISELPIEVREDFLLRLAAADKIARGE